MEVGVRDLKTRLSAYLARVADGEDVVVTDRGRPVARLVPFSSTSAVDSGIKEGWIEAPRRSKLSPTARQRSTSSIAEVLEADRG